MLEKIISVCLAIMLICTGGMITLQTMDFAWLIIFALFALVIIIYAENKY